MKDGNHRFVLLRDAVSEDSLRRVRELYEASFPEAEKKPFELMRKKREEGFFDILAVEDGQGGFCGLAIMLLAGGFALLDYLAIAPECRSGGVGGSVLHALCERYGADRIVVEIESTVGPDMAENAVERLRRKSFYLRNGMRETGLLAELMGVEMEILTYGRKLRFEEYYGIYDAVFPGEVGDKVKKV